MTHIGQLSENGLNVPQDFANARHWYEKAAALGNAKAATPLFQSFKRRPYGRGAPELSGRRLSRVEAWQMVQRRSSARPPLSRRTWEP